jgi:endonuclease G, mitochondrial
MPPKKIKPTSRKSIKLNSESNHEKLKKFVRARGADFLLDKNISSVGIGYKQKNGSPTKELAIQFTVNKKVATDLLESLDTKEIPKSIMVDGVEFQTDVLERSYSKAFKIVAEEIGSIRKTRVDPIMPGVSVANIKISAGTIGCIVFDRETGAPYILSNWHVLHGPEGNLGDTIVQPGPHDDNRVQLNQIGKLVRSHLGPAGDCAVASIEARAFKQEDFEIHIKPEKIGEPFLGDKVVKSGRTTGVTHGIITRINTIVKIDYGGTIGEQSIGGFEIGPDENNLPGDGEISKGGDSGASWLFKSSNGKPSKVMAGLHFAGEGSGELNEYAIACYAQSIFEKLSITLTPPKQMLPAEAINPLGYNPGFLGIVVNTPKLSTPKLVDAVKLNGSEVIKYTHFSLAQSKSSKFAIWVAWNIDGDRLKKISRSGIKFEFDSRFREFQVGDELYSDNRLDRGHIARRADLVWGTSAEAKKANKDSFFFSNITPQIDNFNQGNLGGIWGKLEDAIFEEVDVDNLRVTVFGGPVFRNDDRIFRGVKIPREFYKVIVYVHDGTLKVKAFLLTQNLDELEILSLTEFKVFQVTLGEIGKRCGFSFPANLKAADSFAEKLRITPELTENRLAVEKLSAIDW